MATVLDPSQGTPGIFGGSASPFGGLGGGSGGPFGSGATIDPDETPDSVGDVFGAASDALQESGAIQDFLGNIGVNFQSGGDPASNAGLGFSAPGGTQPPVEPAPSGGLMGASGAAGFLLGAALIFAVLVATSAVDV